MSAMVGASLLPTWCSSSGFCLCPGGWLDAGKEPPKTVMKHNAGRRQRRSANGGMTSISARAVQEQTPPEPPKRPEPVRPPAAKAPGDDGAHPEETAREGFPTAEGRAGARGSKGADADERGRSAALAQRLLKPAHADKDLDSRAVADKATAHDSMWPTSAVLTISCSGRARARELDIAREVPVKPS